MIINICNLNIQIDNKYDFVYKMCKDYLVDNNVKIDFKVTALKEEIKQEIQDTGEGMSIGAYEATVILRKIGYQILKYNAILIHSSVVSLNGQAYGFLAVSGTGKSTHTRLWLKYFEGQDIKYVNGDKPIYRYFDDKLYVCGLPWAGKEGFNSNCIVPVKALCFLERGKTNEIRKLNNEEVVNRIFKQILLPKDLEQANQVFDILNRIIKDVPFYLLKCNISLEAVEVCYSMMKGE